jgi:hypothetical protein
MDQSQYSGPGIDEAMASTGDRPDVGLPTTGRAATSAPSMGQPTTGLTAPGRAVTGQEAPGGSPEPASAMTEEERREPVWVYALGRVEPRFPNLSLEKEFAQVVSQVDAKRRTDRQVMRSVLTRDPPGVC